MPEPLQIVIYSALHMSYLVLARKLRPTIFRDLIGQETIWNTLLNAIASHRVAHAFLFTGSRGVGKTSCARILTKALNCDNPVDHEPCNTCVNCLEISDNISTDVLEIDAASNRGIEHIRALRDSISFSPAKCKFKTYIIDEVHMLTLEAFNALLKTLEEPPSHVKFILATTDPHKIPQTVISRCQRYDFVRIPLTKMVAFLKKVANDESIRISQEALTLIAKNASGGMRDALTALDMLISYGGKNIEDEQVTGILGYNDSNKSLDLIEAIINQDIVTAVEHFHGIVQKGQSLAVLLSGIMEIVKDLTLLHSLPVDNSYWRDFLPSQIKNYNTLKSKVSVSQLDQYFNLLLEIESQIKRSDFAEMCMEMGIIKMCKVETLLGVAEIVSQIRSISGKKKNLMELKN